MNNTTELIEQVKMSLVNLETHNCDLQQRANDLAKETTEAIDCYLADFAQKKEAAKSKITKLEKEISAVALSIRNLYASISETALSDNFDAMKAARTEVEKKKARKADLEFQLTAIKNGQVKGDPTLLASAKAKYEAFLSADKELRSSVEELCHFTYEYENAIESLRNRRKYARTNYPPKIESVNSFICVAISDI